jgi:hypothetical protein
MNLLYDNELIFGRLLTISEPHLIERYNRALAAFGLPKVDLPTFDIDRTGFSPQVAKVLGDDLYLDPNEINRRFIILTPAQAELPVVHTAFSNTSQLMFEFFSENARAINALTIKDVIYGEIEDSVSEVTNIEDLLSINQVEFRVLSGADVLGKASELRTLVDRLTAEPDAWRNDTMIDRMVELAKTTGDIRENQLVPDKVVFRHNAFWTSHFGGLYVFIDPRMTTVICDRNAPGFRRSRPWQVSYIPLDDTDNVFRFLAETRRLQLPVASWTETSGYLEHRAEMAVRHLINQLEPERDLNAVDAVWLQTWMHRNASLITADGTVPFLNQAKRLLASKGKVNPFEVDTRFRFQLVRADPAHPDAWLTNRLISDFVPFDFVSRYVFNKQGFYADYGRFSETWRAHVVETLKSTYLSNKAALRKRLYGLND